MDCPIEEGQVRRALERLRSIRGLRFDLAARTLAIDAPSATWPAIVEAIGEAGFKAETIAEPASAEDRASAQRAEWLRLGLALAVAAAAELIDWLAAESPVWTVVGMATAASAIALSKARREPEPME